MQTYYYDQITAKRVRSGSCPVCGRRVVRSRTFEQTVNPFNKNDDDTVKTGHEVWLAVNEEADTWVPDFTHTKCALAGEA